MLKGIEGCWLSSIGLVFKTCFGDFFRCHSLNEQVEG